MNVHDPQAPVATLLVEREVVIAAPGDVVWACWTDPVRVVRWMGRTASIDLVPGGAIRIEDGNGAVMVGEILEVDQPRRLVFTWGWEDPAETIRPGGSRVEVELDELPEGTRVRVRHHGLPPAEATGHAEGWDYFLGRLGEAAA
jgi:uncharacterized protein YndB with AHSA1/START domain